MKFFLKNSMFHSVYNQIMGDGAFADFNYYKMLVYMASVVSAESFNQKDYSDTLQQVKLIKV